MFERVFLIVAPLVIMVLVGYLYGRHRQPDLGVVNRVNMEVFIPVLLFSALSQQVFPLRDYLPLALGAIAIILGSGCVAVFISRAMGYQWRTFVPPIMFSNWANLGLPLFVFTFGESALNAAVVLIAVGNLLQFSLGRAMLSGSFSVLQLLNSPILISIVLGMIFGSFAIGLPAAVRVSVDMMAQVAIPLMLFALGVRLTRVNWGDWRIGLTAAVVAPAVGIMIAALICYLFDLTGLLAQQLILFGALPPAVVNYMLAEEFAQEPQRVASIVLIANLAALIVIPSVLFWVLA